MPTPKQQLRRALELLEASIDGCTEAIMLAYGFKTELLVELVNADLAPCQSDPDANYCGWPAGALKASMALILERGSASRHRCHSEIAGLRTERGGKCGVGQLVMTRPCRGRRGQA